MFMLPPLSCEREPRSPPEAAQERPGSVSRGHLEPKRAPRAFQSLLEAAREGISAPFRPHFDHFWSHLGIIVELFLDHWRWRLVLAFVSVLLLAFYSLRCFWCVLFGFLVRYFLVPRPAPKKTATQRTNARATLQRRSPDLGRRDSRRVYNLFFVFEIER